MMLSNLEINLEDKKPAHVYESVMCLCMDAGLSPQSLPLPIYSEFPRELSVENYTDRLKEIVQGAGYFRWISERLTVRVHDAKAPVPAYVRPSWFIPPSIPFATRKNEGHSEVQATREHEKTEGRVCMFVADELVFDEAMEEVFGHDAFIKMTIGAGMLRVSFRFS